MNRKNIVNRHKTKKTSPTKPVAPVVRPDPESLEVVVWPDSVLTRRATDVQKIDNWLLQVIERMKLLMESHEGVGLAAPQVGLPLRVFVMAEKSKAAEAIAVINPILELDDATQEAEEGCLSLPGIRGQILRASRIKLSGYDSAGAAISVSMEGFPARIAQHENDHLDGVLILSRMSPAARIAAGKKLRDLEKKKDSQ